MADMTEVQAMEQEAQEYEEDPFMTLDEVHEIIEKDIQRAVDYLESELSPRRARAVDYYKRQLFGDEQEGRSQYVSADVHDTVRGILPDLLRIFFGSEQAVEFAPNNPTQGPMAEQATDYVNKVVMQQDNSGFLVAYEAFHDALLKDLGVIKWVWEESEDVGGITQYSGLTPDLWSMLLADPDVEELMSAMAEDGTITGTIRRKTDRGRVRLYAVPPEEILVNEEARTIEDARLIVHRTTKTASDLLEMGFAWGDIEDHLGSGQDLAFSEERIARRQSRSVELPMEVTEADEANSPILYAEAYRYMDYDGDGVAELCRICCLGTSYEPYRVDEWDEKPFAFFGPDPEPHTLIGGSVADLVMDIQKSKSRLVRALFDSLGRSVDPKQVILDGYVNAEDVENPNLGGVIREDMAGAYRVIELPFVGSQAMPVIQYMDQVKVQRTGNLDAGKALTADVLQSTTASAVDMVYDNSKSQVEMIARIFAETGWKRLFKGILRTIVKHQDIARTVRLRGGFVPVDPRAWDGSLDVSVNVALGGGQPGERAQILGLLAQKQEQVLMQLGPTNPLFTLRQYGNTLKKIAELGGINDTHNYISDVPADWQPPQEDKPDPAMLIAQAELMKAQVQGLEARMETSIDWQKAVMQDNRERDRMELEALAKAWDIQGKIDVEKIRQIAQSRKEKASESSEG